MTDTESFILYMGTFAVSIFFVWLYQKNKIYEKSFLSRVMVLFGIMLPIIIVQGFRFEVGTDYRAYYRIFENSKIGSFYFKAYLSEPLFLWTNIFLKAIFKSPVAYFVFTAIVMNVFFFFVVDYYRDSVDMPMMYLAYYMLCFSTFLNMERQAIAGILFWFSLRFIERKQLVRFGLVMACATLIHNTAVVFMAFYFLNWFIHGKYRKIIKIIVGIACIWFFIYGEDIVKFLINFMASGSKYADYIIMGSQKNEMMGYNIFLYFGMLLFPLVLLYKYLNKAEKNHYIMLACIGSQFVFYFLEQYISYGSRLAFYPYIGLLLYIGRACKCMKRQGNRMIIKGYFIITLCVYYYRIFYFFGHSDVFPYQFWKF